MAKVSVIIPVYKVEQYIEQCARSLFEQTLDDIEYIFVDDCSPDNSVKFISEILESYPKRKTQVIIHKMDQNGGQAVARRWGMQNATGDFVIHCDSDDWIERNAYELAYNMAIESNSDIVFFDFYKSDGVNHSVIKRLKKEFYDKMEMLDLLLCGKVTGSVCGALFKRDLYQHDFDYPKADMGEDWTMMIQMVCNCNTSIAYMAKPLYYYRTNPISISESISEKSIMKRFNDNMINGFFVYGILMNRGFSAKLSESIVYSKYIIRKNLLKLLGSSYNYSKWFRVFPEINHHIIQNTKVSFRDKVIFILCYTRIYHFMRRL